MTGPEELKKRKLYVRQILDAQKASIMSSCTCYVC